MVLLDSMRGRYFSIGSTVFFLEIVFLFEASVPWSIPGRQRHWHTLEMESRAWEGISGLKVRRFCIVNIILVHAQPVVPRHHFQGTQFWIINDV